MKITDLAKSSASSLEFERNCELSSQKHFAPGSRYHTMYGKRIARIDAQIAKTAQRHIEYLRKMMAGSVSRGQMDTAADYAARIAEVKAADIGRAYAGDVPLRADMLSELEAA